MELASARVVLRDFVEGDLVALARYQADPRYAEYWPDDAPNAEELLGRFMAWAREEPRRNYQLAIALSESPLELIGTGGVRGDEGDPGVAEFGLEIGPDWWGRGYATEAARVLLDFGFRELGLREIRGVSVTENWRVSAMISRLGFVALGQRPGPPWMDARGWTRTEWLLTREHWERGGAA